MLDPEKLDSLTVDELVSAYLDSIWVSETDDPLDDVVNILKIASLLGGGIPDPGVFERSRPHTIVDLIKLSAEAAAKCCPARDCTFWKEVFEQTLGARYGGTTVYIKGKKSINPDHVKHLTPEQIQKEYGCSRSYAYKLLSKK